MYVLDGFFYTLSYEKALLDIYLRLLKVKEVSKFKITTRKTNIHA
jgi:hypothetical protein